jgi:hypothetical protein
VKTISIESRRSDGAGALKIGESPWYVVAIASLVGHYNPYWGWDYRLWSKVLSWSDQKTEPLVAVPIEHSCEIANELWGQRECYHDLAGKDTVS